MIDAKPAIVLIVERREMPQTIFGKDARVVCEVYRRVYEAGKPAQRFMRCRVVVPAVKP